MKSSMCSSGSSASLSLSSSSEGASEVSAAGFREDDLRRALRHHARALKALRGSAYETLSEATRSELITKLENDWSDLKQRLRRLQTPESEPPARSSDSSDAAPDSAPPVDPDGWIQRLTSGLRS